MKQAHNNSAPDKHRRERGSVLVISAFGMLTFLLATGLCVDISHFYLVKTELQNAADAAALAAASGLNQHSSGIIKARQRAIAAMNNYEFNHTPLTLTAANVRYAVNLTDFDSGSGMDEASAMASPTNIRFAKVTTPPAPVNVFFASVLNGFGNSRNLQAAATAGRSVNINTFCDWIPLTVILDEADTILTPGQVYTIRSDPGNYVSPGNYHILAVDGSGGWDVETGTGGGVHVCKEPGDVYPIDTKPGITAGKVRTGINSRFDDFGGSQLDPALFPPDKNVKENVSYVDYSAATAADPAHFQAPAHAGVDYRRLVIIPLVKQSEFDTGRGVVRFSRFGLFFLRTKVSNGSGGDFQAEYVQETLVVGSGGYDPSGTNASVQMTIPVLYK
ncbi:MAG: pilus assembly protein TadG-related protein [Pyrinomonadaceae bacterium]